MHGGRARIVGLSTHRFKYIHSNHVRIEFRIVVARGHRYVLATMPGVFAARMRSAVQRTRKKAKGELSIPDIEHRGRAMLPIAYVAGVGLLFAGSVWAMMHGAMDPVPAVLMPWAGFYWGKLFFWRGVIEKSS